ncbi:hypothetical protein [Acidocella sp.]|uniref:hypothetical protein n=1 Tax=Acidocella sp. TaxID=50710 RepID=UPI003D052645
MTGTEAHMEDHHTSLRLILNAVGEEFRELGRFSERFQVSLSPAVRNLALDPACHRDVQSLDLLAQRLAALSGYIMEISQLLPDDLMLDSRNALASITLSELQYRLKGAPVPIEEGHRSGELELF